MSGAAMLNQVNEAIQTHYSRLDVGSVILAALEKVGKDLDHLTPEDLAPVDEFHIRGGQRHLNLLAPLVLMPISTFLMLVAVLVVLRDVSRRNSAAALRALTSQTNTVSLLQCYRARLGSRIWLIITKAMPPTCRLMMEYSMLSGRNMWQ